MSVECEPCKLSLRCDVCQAQQANFDGPSAWGARASAEKAGWLLKGKWCRCPACGADLRKGVLKTETTR